MKPKAIKGIPMPKPIQKYWGTPKGPGAGGCVRNQAVIGSPMAAAITAMAVMTLMLIMKKPFAGVQ